MPLLFSAKTLVSRNYHLFLKRSAYIFMFNKTIVLFHHFFRLFNLFLYILMQYFVNSYLHMYSYYPQGKKARKFKKRTAASFGYV